MWGFGLSRSNQGGVRQTMMGYKLDLGASQRVESQIPRRPVPSAPWLSTCPLRLLSKARWENWPLHNQTTACGYFASAGGAVVVLGSEIT